MYLYKDLVLIHGEDCTQGVGCQLLEHDGVCGSVARALICVAEVMCRDVVMVDESLEILLVFHVRVCEALVLTSGAFCWREGWLCCCCCV